MGSFDTTADRSNWILCCRILANSSTAAYGVKNGNAFIHKWNNANWLTNSGASGSSQISSSVAGSQRLAVDWNIVTQQAYFGGTDKNLDIISTSGNLDKRYPTTK